MGIFAEKMWVAHFFSKNISIYAIFNDESFNDKLTNNIVNFEQLGPESDAMFCSPWIRWSASTLFA